MKQAFTLIELLVVIAIIAILAAILFPVFAQAKAAAKKTASLSNLKQIGTSSQMYTTDYDDRFPSIYDGDHCGGDPPCTLYPYTKSYAGDPNIGDNTGTSDIWHAVRTDADTDNEGVAVPRRDYGYNWGFEIRGASAMIDGELCADGGDVQGCGGRGYPRYNAGKSITVMANPSRLFAWGDTYDTPRQTMGGDGWIFDALPSNFNRNSSLRWGGLFNEVYADGHAHSVAFKGGNLSGLGLDGDRVGSPKNFQDRVDGYCFDPNAAIMPFPRLGYPFGSMKCSDFVAFPEAFGAQWWSD